jgi:hypothetical protein
VVPCFYGIWDYPDFINKPWKEELNEDEMNIQALWYIGLPALFNLGWSSVQVAHMSIVNQLT